MPSTESAWRWSELPAGAARASAGLLLFDAPGREVNVLTEPVLRELRERIREARERRLAAIVLASAKSGFCAGADVDAIASVASAAEGAAKAALGQAAYRELAECGIPVVAAIHGACVGGGAELAAWCAARVATWDERTRIGFPEVKLGIVPGFGGTQVLPRIVGLRAAIELASTGRLLSPKDARRIGLVDAVVEREHLLAEAGRWADRLAAGERPPRGGRSSWPIARDVVAVMARRAARKATAGHYPAPLETIRLCRAALSTPLSEGLADEAATLGRLVAGDVSRNLLHVYSLQREAERGGIAPPPGALLGVLGAGVMGAGIAGVAASRGWRARVRDVQPAALAKGAATVRDVVGRATRRARDPRLAARQAADRASFSLTLDGFRDADVVVEAVVERMDVKRAVLAELEAAAGSGTLLATNTSSLSVGGMAEALARPERFVGLHFFNPVPQMPLVEIVRGPATSDASVERARGWVLALGKTPVVVADAPGFLVNRLLMPYLQEALAMQAEGLGIDAIDRAARRFGMAMGPFRVLDEVGLDVASHAAASFAAAFPGRFAVSPVLARLVALGRLGKKSGGGFREKRGRRHVPWSGLGEPSREEAPGEIERRLTSALAAEASLCLAEGVVASERDLDLATIFAMGFPPFRGGLATWMRSRAAGA